ECALSPNGFTVGGEGWGEGDGSNGSKKSVTWLHFLKRFSAMCPRHREPKSSVDFAVSCHFIDASIEAAVAKSQAMDGRSGLARPQDDSGTESSSEAAIRDDRTKFITAAAAATRERHS
ncbi:MAG: hypothetical protein ACREPZ_02135, partial [Rhodanobacteraceae bacterium]